MIWPQAVQISRACGLQTMSAEIQVHTVTVNYHGHLSWFEFNASAQIQKQLLKSLCLFAIATAPSSHAGAYIRPCLVYIVCRLRSTRVQEVLHTLMKLGFLFGGTSTLKTLT